MLRQGWCEGGIGNGTEVSSVKSSWEGPQPPHFSLVNCKVRTAVGKAGQAREDNKVFPTTLAHWGH